MREQQFDLVILGSGSTALAAALRAGELGKTAAMTEERTLGGICVTRGCVPSKNLIEAAGTLHESWNPRYPGLSQASMALDFSALVDQKNEIIHDFRVQEVSEHRHGLRASSSISRAL